MSTAEAEGGQASTATMIRLSQKRKIEGRVGVVDIGSNSIRLVVFDGLRRAPLPVFNERVLCGLGKGLRESGQLDPEGVVLALTNLYRFSRLADAMGVGRIDLLATAAVREASNGKDFVERVEEKTGRAVTVLTGEDEARLAALGVVCGTPGADGLMGDLGGGSLEIVELDKGRVGRTATLGLGPLRLMHLAGDEQALKSAIDAEFEKVPWLADLKGKTFFPVGGAWRSLARIEMEQRDYPLHVIHGFGLSRRDAQDMARLISRLGPRSLARIPKVSRRRLETLPTAALLMNRLLKRAPVDRVVFSAFGLREGHLYDLLPETEQERDPLLVAASDMAESDGRFGDLGHGLMLWTDPIFPDDDAAGRRLRLAACHLSDVAWRDHPDYRADQALFRLLRLPLLAVNHAERAFMAYTVFMRYGGSRDMVDATRARQLLPAAEQERAEILGAALRLAYSLSGGTEQILQSSSLTLSDGKLSLTVPQDGSMPSGDVVERRLNRLVKAMGFERQEIL
ncbi:MAG: Ppx/GppA family phosphatase [Rhodovibrionaceae bacterium]|nr:Ppx/GppA family phosphatase [Rhodovibrionaceae bacterium]